MLITHEPTNKAIKRNITEFFRKYIIKITRVKTIITLMLGIKPTKAAPSQIERPIKSNR
jgi:hypothetical protein